MQVACPHCRRAVQFADQRPTFCAFCGGSLAGALLHEAATHIHVEETRTYVSRAQDVDAGDRFDTAAGDGGLAPEIVGDYKLGRKLGQGGMGVVYEADQAATGRRVALKLLSPRLAQTNESMERFLREGRLAAAFSHPRSTFVFGAGQHAGQPYITMELMPGRTLADVCRDEGPLPVNRSVDYILDVIEGLKAAHAAGVIHRDVKPSNCFLDSDGRVKVGDFGLSKSLVSDAALTRTGAFLGTPLFAAPEQVKAGPIDARTDVYSVGATLFYLIAGRGPFTGDPAAVIAQIASDPASLRRLVPAVPKDLDELVARTMEKDPHRRFADFALLQQALQPFATGGLVAAPVGRRAGAYFLDMLMTGALFGILVFIFVFVVIFTLIADAGGSAGASGFQSQPFPQFVPVVVGSTLAFAVVVVSYFAICEAWTGQSLGKRWLGLRVVGLDGGRPRIGRAFLRAALVPGLTWLAVAALAPLQLASDQGEAETIAGQSHGLVVQLLNHVALIPMLAFLLTMRARNGYLGLHDLASGTRVVQIRGASGASRTSDVPLVVPCALDGPEHNYGPFRVMGSLGRTSNNEIVLQARDEVLHRLAWIFVRPLGHAGDICPLDGVRAGLDRPTRPRWLQGGESGPLRWDALEAVVGAPLRLALTPAHCDTWKHGRSLLLELAEELVAASAEGTLPTSLTLGHVWLDRDGRVKLVDAASVSLGANGRHAASPATQKTLTPVGLFRAAVQLFSQTDMQNQALPVHARDFIAELTHRPEEIPTLTWAVAQLREFVNFAPSLTWSDRLVAVGVSTGTEHAFYEIPICLLMLALLSVPAITEPVRLAAIFSLAAALPIVVGFWTRGGPVFRLVGIDVRRSDGQPAGRVRCAWRNLVAWLPVMLSHSVAVAVLPSLLETTNSGTSLVPALDGPSDEWRALLMAFVAMAPGFLMLMHAAGACYAIARPQRGIQDLLAGTRLVPR